MAVEGYIPQNRVGKSFPQGYIPHNLYMISFFLVMVMDTGIHELNLNNAYIITLIN